MGGYRIYITILVIWMEMTMIQGNCPIAECTCLDGQPPSNERIIDCREKGLLSVPAINATEEIFQELTLSNAPESNCRGLSPQAKCNRILHISSNAFAGLKVRKIDFSQNYLGSSVASDSFRGLETYLTELILEGDDTNLVPFSSLTTLTKLKSLTLERFTLNNNGIGIESFPQDFTDLETLVLHTLKMQFISSNSVSGKLRNLKRLEILDNPDFTTFPLGAIRKLTTLEHIRFVQNGIHTFYQAADAFIGLNKLTTLDLSHNELATLQAGCFSHLYDNLEYLGLHLNYLNGQSLVTLKEGNWTKLEQLILDSNPIGSIEVTTNLFKNMPHLANLNLQQTQLTRIGQNDFVGLSNLQFLHLSGNEITHIDPGTFNKTPSLKELYLDSVGKSDDKLSFSKDTAEGLQNLLRIDFKLSHIEPIAFWDSLKVMTNLQHIYLENNGLLNIPDLTFQYHTEMKSLEIANNGLTELTQAQIHGLGNTLTSLQLTGNNIKLIDKCVIEELSVLENLYLDQNPMHCDCKLTKLYEWAKLQESSNSIFGYILRAVCSTPQNLYNRLLTNVSSSDLVCQPGTQPTQCQTFTTSTTSTTTPSTTTVPLPVISLNIGVRDEQGLSFSWNVLNEDQLSKFFITHQQLGTSETNDPVQVDSNQRQWTLNLDYHKDYSICIKAKTTDNRVTVPDCKNSLGGIKTTFAPTASPSTGLGSGEIAAIGAGCALVLILIVVILFFLIRYQTRPKYKDTPPVHFTAFAARPTTGYDSKRFSKPKKPHANGDLKVSAISSGKTGEPSSPNSRHSAGSYQYLNENQMINIQPHLNNGKGASGTSRDLPSPPGYYQITNNPKHAAPQGYLNDPHMKQRENQGYLKDSDSKENRNLRDSSSNKPRYDKTPGQLKGQAPQPHSYVNDHQGSPPSVYTNDIKDRPLPKPRTKHYENNNTAGFLNHGFDLDSPTQSPTDSPSDHTYHEITPETEI
ncbi:slit homolog 3 protein-like [Mytilus trossulus]|uniref:slit homolog 3 protein-like n=1 Tax=Mytilus trossulus TaxID=6551 RepID=UPI003004D49B